MLEGFKRIGLEELDSLSLLNRQDSKYVMPISKLPNLLKNLTKSHVLLEINGHSSFHYNNLYFDTPEQLFYTEHHRGRTHRYKMRLRQYQETDEVFFEIKRKNNKDRTDKRRFSMNSIGGDPIDHIAAFIKEHSPFTLEQLEERVHIDFERITLASFEQQHRLTIDRNLSYYFPEGQVKKMEKLCIIEVKQGRAVGKQPLWFVLKKAGAKPISMSKYCLANMALDPKLKAGRFKPKLRMINKLLYANTA